MKITINEPGCIGCGACVAICEDVFEMNDEGISVIKNSNITDDMKDSVTEAIEACPTAAIIEA